MAIILFIFLCLLIYWQWRWWRWWWWHRRWCNWWEKLDGRRMRGGEKETVGGTIRLARQPKIVLQWRGGSQKWLWWQLWERKGKQRNFLVKLSSKSHPIPGIFLRALNNQLLACLQLPTLEIPKKKTAQNSRRWRFPNGISIKEENVQTFV